MQPSRAVPREGHGWLPSGCLGADDLRVQEVISAHRSDELRQGSVLSACLGAVSPGQWGHVLPKEQCPKPSCLSRFKPAMTKHRVVHGRATPLGSAGGLSRLTTFSNFFRMGNLKPSWAGEGCF